MKLVLATRNPHKVKELKDMLGNEDIDTFDCRSASTLSRVEWVEILSLQDFPDMPEIKEDGNSLRENAIIKAEAALKKTGYISMADDSGLEVYALDNKPGVHSARFAGENVDYSANNEKLLKLMRHIPEENRGACFRCVIAIAHPGEDTEVVEGRCEGAIALEPKGINGFGYDPVFIDPAFGKTFAELTFSEKNKISHRSKALAKACKILKGEKSG